MIPAGGKITVDAFENSSAVVANFDGFSVHRFRCTDDLAAEMLSYRLMSKANSEDRKLLRQSLDYL